MRRLRLKATLPRHPCWPTCSIMGWGIILRTVLAALAAAAATTVPATTVTIPAVATLAPAIAAVLAAEVM